MKVTFNELINDKLKEAFSEFKDHNSLSSFVTYAYPKSIAYALVKKMFDGDKPSSDVVIYSEDKPIITYTLTVNKKGDSVAFIPSFEISDEGLENILADEFDADLSVIANSITGKSDEYFIEAFKEVLNGNTLQDNEWVKNKEFVNANGEGYNGLQFDNDLDVKFVANLVSLGILEILSNVKDSSADVVYEVPALGEFTVSPTKNAYKVTLAFSKEFKQDCKSDALAEKMASIVE